MKRDNLYGFLKRVTKMTLLFFIVCVLFSDFCFSQQVELQSRGEQSVIPLQSKPGETKISLDIKGMEITDVLKMLALRSGMN
ncbi:MAG: hypothetical protein NC828_01195, partial [Candidatus Omnitrophica bacterium]|nr:hypothetical protein [Candidatus Omnitrophota bacterium]